MTRGRKIIAGALVALALFTTFDHAMRVDQRNLCMKSDSVECPDHLWWFGGAPAVERVLVGLDCKHGPVVVATEEDDPAFEGNCRTIEVHAVHNY